MKKAIAFFALLCMLASLVSCADWFKEEDEKAPEQTQETLMPGYYEEEEQLFPEINPFG